MEQTKDEQLHTILTRGVAESIGGEELKKRLAGGEKLRVKLGIDPTSPNIHVGRAIPLLKLRDFQQAGHTVVCLVGDFTGVIGDTSDKESERPMLTIEEIEENKKSYFAQMGKLIDLEKAELVYNSAWLEKLTYREIGEHADKFSVADFIARDNIKKRLDAGKRVSLREVLYPLMQGYDSVAVQADVELGGTDQRFNLLAGRTLQQAAGQEPQSILMGPLINGLDGRKMSSSWGNTINLHDTPEDMYGKVMSLHDDLVGEYFELCTRVPLTRVQEVREGVAQGGIHPKDAKMELARELVTLYHSTEAAEQAQAGFIETFQKGGVPEDIPTIPATQGALLVDVLVGAGVVNSKTDWRRLVEGNAVHVLEGADTKTITDVHQCVTEPCTLKVGKRRFVRIELGAGK